MTTWPERGDGSLVGAGRGSAVRAAASRAGDSGIGLGVETAGGEVVKSLFNEGDESSRSCLLETEPAMEAVSESGGGGVAEPARPGKPGRLNAVEERRITVPTRERKVDFFGGDEVAAIVVHGGALQGCRLKYPARTSVQR